MMVWYLAIGCSLAFSAGAVFIGYFLTRKPKPKKPAKVQVDEEGYAPLPIDPANPPTWRYYRPKPSNTIARRTCHCHDRVIKVDQKVLWWPLPDGSVRLLCEDADMKAAKQ